MILTDEEWFKTNRWLTEYRVSLKKEIDKATHEKISKFYNDKSIEIREFLKSKSE